MISFSLFGHRGMFGNQLFQYAFLRTQALRLGVQFYCPNWAGDELFDLKDQKLRAPRAMGLIHKYSRPISAGTNHNDTNLQDNTEIEGFLVGKDNFDKNAVHTWYVFKDEVVKRVGAKYASIDFDTSVGVHVRLCDRLEDDFISKLFFTPRRSYYRKALKKVARFTTVLVFSDDIPKAKKYLKNLPYEFVFMEGNSFGDDLYLMTRCRDLICGPSTFSWWGAFLNSHPDKIIIFPKEGEIRPHGPLKNTDLLFKEWITIPALIPIVDSYPAVVMRHYITRPLFRLGRAYNKFVGKVGVYIRKKFPHLFMMIQRFSPGKK